MFPMSSSCTYCKMKFLLHCLRRSQYKIKFLLIEITLCNINTKRFQEPFIPWQLHLPCRAAWNLFAELLMNILWNLLLIKKFNYRFAAGMWYYGQCVVTSLRGKKVGVDSYADLISCFCTSAPPELSPRSNSVIFCLFGRFRSNSRTVPSLFVFCLPPVNPRATPHRLSPDALPPTVLPHQNSRSVCPAVVH